MLPNFIIVGAPKSGTTSLWHYLSEHPQIFMSSRKEPHFFSVNKYNLSLPEYEKLFSDVKNEAAIGESSVTYFWHPEAALNIKKHIPECKIIIILRNPVDRLYSAFQHCKRKRLITDNFNKFVQKIGIQNNSEDYFTQYILGKNKGYADPVKLFRKQFGKENVFIGLLNELINDPLKFISDIYTFLNVDNSFKPNLRIKYNIGGETRFNSITKSIRTVGLFLKPVLSRIFSHHFLINTRDRFFFWLTGNAAPPMSLQQRKKLTDMFKSDILEVQSIIKKDLTYWLI
jgi:hypothetical protein